MGLQNTHTYPLTQHVNTPLSAPTQTNSRAVLESKSLSYSQIAEGIQKFTPIGKIIHWIFSKEEKKSINEIKVTPTENSSLRRRVSSTQNLYQQVVKEPTKPDAQRDFSDDTPSYYHICDNGLCWSGCRSDIAYYLTSSSEGSVSSSGALNEPMCGIMHPKWYISYNEPLTVIGAKSNNPEGFAVSYSKCITHEGVSNYLRQVDQLYTCQTTPGRIVQNLQYFTFEEYMYYGMGTVIFTGQEGLNFSSSIADACYEKNLIQAPNLYPVPVITQIGEEEYEGSYNVEYFKGYCVKDYALQEWMLTLPSFGVSQNLPYYNDYSACATQQVLDYFQSVEQGAGCTCVDLNPSTQKLHFVVGSDGAFDLQSPNGFLSNQFSYPTSLNNSIQQCYMNYMNENYMNQISTASSSGGFDG
jgi:hypothetical protein